MLFGILVFNEIMGLIKTPKKIKMFNKLFIIPYKKIYNFRFPS